MRNLILILILFVASCTPTNVYLLGPQQPIPIPIQKKAIPKADTVADTHINDSREIPVNQRKIIEQTPIEIYDNTELFADELDDVSPFLSADADNQIYISKTGIYMLEDLPQGIYQINMISEKATIILPLVGSQPMEISQERTMLIVHGKEIKKWKPSA